MALSARPLGRAGARAARLRLRPHALTNRPLSGQALPVMVGCAGAGASGSWRDPGPVGGARRRDDPPSFVPPPAAGYAGDGGALAVNDLGDMAGFYTLTSGERSAMAWTRQGAPGRISTLWPRRTAAGLCGWPWGSTSSGKSSASDCHGADVRAFRADLKSGIVIDSARFLRLSITPPSRPAPSTPTVTSSERPAGPPTPATIISSPDRAFFFSDATRLVDLNTLATPPADGR